MRLGVSWPPVGRVKLPLHKEKPRPGEQSKSTATAAAITWPPRVIVAQTWLMVHTSLRTAAAAGPGVRGGTQRRGPRVEVVNGRSGSFHRLRIDGLFAPGAPMPGQFGACRRPCMVSRLIILDRIRLELLAAFRAFDGLLHPHPPLPPAGPGSHRAGCSLSLIRASASS